MWNEIFSKAPNWLTILRTVAIPVVIVIYLFPDSYLSIFEKNICATTVFILASITDWLDGYIARRYQMYSRFGEFLDPVADKLLVCSVLIIIVHLDRIHPIVAIIIIGREIAVSALREWMANINQVIHVSALGKWKTTLQLIGIILLLFYGKLFFIPAEYIIIIGKITIWIATILTIISMFDYLHRSSKIIQNKNIQ